jgi:uncharacterized membrane protein
VHFLNPNYHVILIHYPLGVFMAGIVIELFSFLWKRSSARTAARWMILLGGLSSLPAATSGIFALSDVINNQALSPEREHLLRLHVWLQSIASLLAVLTAVFAIAAADEWRQKFHWTILFVFLMCAGLFVSGAYFGGESVYREAVAVQIPKTPIGIEESQPAMADTPHMGHHGLLYYTGEPVQIHMIVAGVAFALALASLGLSIRQITAEPPELPEPPLIASETSAAAPTVAGDPAPVFRDSHYTVDVSDYARPGLFVPAARFWLVAALIVLATGIAGYWVWADSNSTWLPARFWNDLMVDNGKPLYTRAAIHVWVGTLLVILTLLLAALARWASQQKTVLTIFAALLVLAIALQVWLGILLQFDGGDGPLYRFSNQKDSTSASIDMSTFFPK